MVVSGLVSIALTFTRLGPMLFGPDGAFEGYYKFPFVVLVTTLSWLAVTFLTPPEDEETLNDFYKKIQPGGNGWNPVLKNAKENGIDLIDTSIPSNLSHGIFPLVR